MSQSPETKIRAALDGRDLPCSLFGTGRGARTRKLVFLTLATYANPDGTNAWPSQGTLADQCGLTDRALRDVIDWLTDNGFFSGIEYKAGPCGTNIYTLRLDGSGILLARQSQTRKQLLPGTTSKKPVVDPEAITSGCTRKFEPPTRKFEPADPEVASSDNRPSDRPSDRQGTVLAAKTAPRNLSPSPLEEKRESQNPPQEKTFPASGAHPYEDPPSVRIAKERVAKEQAALGRQMRTAPYTEEEIAEQKQRLREQFPEQFEKAEKRGAHAAD